MTVSSRPTPLLHLVARRLRHVAGCRACRDTHVLRRQAKLRPEFPHAV